MPIGSRRDGLRRKIIAWSFVPTAIILLAVALITFTAYQQVTEDLVIERDRELTRLTAIQLAAEVTEYADLLGNEARSADIYRAGPDTQRAALQQALSRLAIFDGGVFILDSYGAVVAAEPDRSDLLGHDWSDRLFFRQLLSSARPAFSNILADGPDGAPVIIVAVPITSDKGRRVGVLGGMFRLGQSTVSTFYGDVVKLRIEASSSAYLVDGAGRVIYHTDLDQVGADFSAEPVVERVIAGTTGAERGQDLSGQEIVAAYAPVPGTPWGLVTQESWAVLTSGSRVYQRNLILLLVLGVLAPALVVAVGVRRITQPIEALISAAQAVAGGDFGRTITARTGDEIEELAEQFNRMSAQLQESYAHLEQRVAEKTRELSTLNTIATIVSQSLELDPILNNALDETLQAMDIEAGGIYLLDREAGVLTVAVHRGFSPQFVAGIDGLKVGEGFSGLVAQSGRPLIVRDVSADPRLTRVVAREEGLRSIAITPLNAKGEVLGTLFAVTHGYREFTDEDVELLTSIGNQIGVAVENARLFKSEQRRAEQFRVIAEAARQITSILDVDELLAETVRLLKETFGYYMVTIGLIEGDALVFKAGAKTGWQESAFRPPSLRLGGQGITAWVAATGESLLAPDVSQEPQFVFLPDSAETRAELAVPIKTKSSVIGVLNVESDQVNAFDESDLTVLQSLANQAAMAIETARLFEAEQRRAEQFRVISEVGHRISSIMAVDELIGPMVRLIKEAFAYYGVSIGLIEGDRLVFKAGSGSFWDDPQFQQLTLRVGEEGITGWVASTGKPLIVPDVSLDDRYYLPPLAHAGETRSELAVPMQAKGVVIGVLDVNSDQLDAFDESDLTVLQSLANQAAVAIDNARLYERAQHVATVEERQRLARELHDAVTQTLFSASLIAEAVPAALASDQAEGLQLLGQLRQLTRGALAEMRTLLLELRPTALIEANLGDLLRQLAEAATGRAGLPVEVTAPGRVVLPSAVHVAFYRIAQEATNNIVKHARASQAAILLRAVPASDGTSTAVELRVSDDGRGFDPEREPPERLGLGLGIMRERAQAIGASFDVDSQPGQGTRISLVWIGEGDGPLDT